MISIIGVIQNKSEYSSKDIINSSSHYNEYYNEYYNTHYNEYYES